jgi:hypothetical protein
MNTDGPTRAKNAGLFVSEIGSWIFLETEARGADAVLGNIPGQRATV